MDFNASLALSGLCTQDELVSRLAVMVALVAAGEPTKSEKLGHREFFIPYKYQEKQVTMQCACEM